jgi:hypothetical protein
MKFIHIETSYTLVVQTTSLRLLQFKLGFLLFTCDMHVMPVHLRNACKAR